MEFVKALVVISVVASLVILATPGLRPLLLKFAVGSITAITGASLGALAIIAVG